MLVMVAMMLFLLFIRLGCVIVTRHGALRRGFRPLVMMPMLVASRRRYPLLIVIQGALAALVAMIMALRALAAA